MQNAKCKNKLFDVDVLFCRDLTKIMLAYLCILSQFLLRKRTKETITLLQNLTIGLILSRLSKDYASISLHSLLQNLVNLS